MLGQVNPTPYDLYFPLFGIPVRVTPWFWLAGVLMGYGLIEQKRFDLLVVWLGCLFLSILVHEMGHALAGKLFGWPSDIILYHFGGVARYYHQDGYTTGRSVVACVDRQGQVRRLPEWLQAPRDPRTAET